MNGFLFPGLTYGRAFCYINFRPDEPDVLRFQDNYGIAVELRVAE